MNYTCTRNALNAKRQKKINSSTSEAVQNHFIQPARIAKKTWQNNGIKKTQAMQNPRQKNGGRNIQKGLQFIAKVTDSNHTWVRSRENMDLVKMGLRKCCNPKMKSALFVNLILHGTKGATLHTLTTAMHLARSGVFCVAGATQALGILTTTQPSLRAQPII